MIVTAILACDEEWGIGKDGDMPWPRNRADLKWFKDTTVNCAVVMGRGTWDSAGMPKPLPNRRNIVITNRPIDGVECYTLDKFKSMYNLIEQRIFIIGGAGLVTSTLDIVDEFLISRIKGTYNCDTVLPKDAILKDFEFYEHYFDGSITIQKYKRIENETIS
jgi:dihydrofolate reductase